MNSYKVLIADDEEGVRELFKAIALDEGYQVFLASDGLEAVQLAAKILPDVIVLDVRMPNMDGLEAFERIREHMIDVPVIFITAFGSPDLAIEAMKNGAYNYLTKPFDMDEIRIVIRKAIDLRKLTNEVAYLKANTMVSGESADLIGETPVMQDIFKTIGKVSESHASVLLLGEHGTGKETLAKKIHLASPNKDLPFIMVNGFAEDSVFAIELNKLHTVEQATVLFRNIDILSLNSQANVRDIYHSSIGYRFIATANSTITKLVKEGKFLEDLFYLMNVVSIDIPPLRERTQDIQKLSVFFLQKYSQKYGKLINQFSEACWKTLQEYSFPGNIDELENAIAHAVIITKGLILDAEDLPITLTEKKSSQVNQKSTLFLGMTLNEAVKEFEKNLIIDVLKQNQNNKTKTAETLGISRRSLFNKMREYHLLKDNESEPY
ncbi:sigma-54 dependent transcriptional regulator [bacterium]|nr:sigma-54 dependent transcriptional regulator [bacterium]